MAKFHENRLFVDNLLYRAVHFTWGRPEPPTETNMEDDELEDDAELNLEKVEEEMAAEYSEEEEDEILHIDDLQAVLPGNLLSRRLSEKS